MVISLLVLYGIVFLCYLAIESRGFIARVIQFGQFVLCCEPCDRIHAID